MTIKELEKKLKDFDQTITGFDFSESLFGKQTRAIPKRLKFYRIADRFAYTFVFKKGYYGGYIIDKADGNRVIRTKVLEQFYVLLSTALDQYELLLENNKK